MKIYTNHHERQFAYSNEVPEDVLDSQFDYQDRDELHAGRGFFKYRGYWYHLDGFVSCPKGMFEGKWNGYTSDSFFSGVLIAISDDGETYKVATYID